MRVIRVSCLLAVVYVGSLAGCSAEGTEDRNTQASAPVSWEAFQAAATRFVDGKPIYVVEWDQAVTENELRQRYDAYAARVRAAAEGLGESEQASIVDQFGGVDDVYPNRRQLYLTYCISNAFGTNKARVVSEMAQATAAWERAGRVDFTYVPAQDASCTGTNFNVNFAVAPWQGGGACSFAPLKAGCVARSLVIDIPDLDANYGTVAPNVRTVGVFRHELGHILGLRHEHTRPQSGMCFEDNQWRALTPYDRSSVMHYPWCNGVMTSDLSITSLDAQGISQLYGSNLPALTDQVVFAITSSGTLYQNFLSNAGWHGWDPGFDSAPGNVRSVAMSHGPIAGALEVFIVAGGVVYHDFLNSGGWHGWEAGFNGAPSNIASVALAQGPIGGALETFAVSATGTLYHNFLNNGGWHGWEVNFNGAPGDVTSIALSQGPIGGALEVFATTAHGVLYHNFLNNSGWHGWEAGFNGAPTGIVSVALAQGPIGGALETFAVSATGTLYHNFLNNGGWHGWEVNFDGAPGGVRSVALSQGPIGGALETFAVTSSGTLYHNFLNNGGWHGWEVNFNGAPTNVTSVGLAQGPIVGALETFATTSSGTLYHNFLNSGGWHGWEANFDLAPAGMIVALPR